MTLSADIVPTANHPIDTYDIPAEKYQIDYTIAELPRRQFAFHNASHTYNVGRFQSPSFPGHCQPSDASDKSDKIASLLRQTSDLQLQAFRSQSPGPATTLLDAHRDLSSYQRIISFSSYEPTTLTPSSPLQLEFFPAIKDSSTWVHLMDLDQFIAQRHTTEVSNLPQAIFHAPSIELKILRQSSVDSLVDDFRRLSYTTIADRIEELHAAVDSDDDYQSISTMSGSTMLEFLSHLICSYGDDKQRHDNVLSRWSTGLGYDGMLEARWDNPQETASIMFIFQDDSRVWFASFDDARGLSDTDTLPIDAMAAKSRRFIATVSV